MPVQDQLEIIYPNGDIEFHDLDPRGDVANIGRHSDNDIVIDSLGVALFHAVLDYGQKPYHITLLNQGGLEQSDGDTMLGGQPLAPHTPAELHNWDTVEIAGHVIILLENVGTAAAAPPPAAVAGGEQALIVPPPAETSVAPFRRALSRLPTRPLDRSDDTIIMELSEREWTVDVEQVATCQVTITNGGGIVATFVVHVEGVAEDWVTILPPQVNLNEGGRTTVTIGITPPRHSSSRAGPHHLAVVVTSPNYSGRSSQQGATLTVNPYYEFAVGELSPKQQTVGGRRPSGEAVVHIANKGNCDANFRLEAADDARALNFEFEVAGETTNLARQAEMHLPPEETFAVPVHIVPVSPPFIGLRKRNHSFTITAAILEGGLTPRSLLGQFYVRPVIGPWLMALFALLMALLVVLIFYPRISTFSAFAQDNIISDDVPNPGETVRLTWQTWPPFNSVRIEATWESGVTTPIRVENGDYQTDDHPPQDVIYTLTAENFLSRLLGFIPSASSQQEIDVFPLDPRIIAFNPDMQEIVTGQTVTLRWLVENADQVTLAYSRSDGNTGEIVLAPAEYESGVRQEIPPVPTTYRLCVVSKYSEDRPCEERIVTVLEPTPTPLPVPVIRSFSVLPREIYAGENVTITWEVENATSVKIVRDGIEEEKTALTGETIQTLAQLGVAKYKLIVIYDDGKGHPDGPSTRESDEHIIVVLEEPPEPQKPVIEDFRVVPNKIVRGSDETVQLVWAVTGDTTDIGVSGPTLSLVNNLDKTGSIPVSADATTFFILTAHNGDLSSSQMVELAVEEPPPPPTPVPPPPVIEYFGVRGAQDPGDVQQIGDAEYRVVSGAKVQFSWVVNNTSQLTLEFPGGTTYAQPLEGDSTPMVIRAGGTYQLIAANDAGAEARALIQITIENPEPPPIPYNVGCPLLETTSFTITWSYDADHLDDIIGFRIYRGPAGAPRNLANRVVDETELDNVARTWSDPSPICGQSYYVVAVYEIYDDLGEKQKLETDPHDPDGCRSWICPTP